MNYETLTKIAVGKIDKANANSMLTALVAYGPKFGLDQPHRQVQYLAQLFHESGSFRYDREIWGPTPAQAKYDTRKDLGNTPEIDGDGKLYMGRTGIQLTGKANYTAFRDWCRANIDPKAPDFVKRPDLVNTDPWEGLAPIWYWDTKKLNRYADRGDVEMITKKINGGLNGYEDRLRYLTRASLVYLGYPPDQADKFQRENGLLQDGIVGPATRSKMHELLLKKTPQSKQADVAANAPVVVDKEVAVVPPALDKPVEKTSGFWERIGSIATAGSGLGALIFGDWRVTAAALVGVILLTSLGLLFHSQIIAAVKKLKEET